MKLTLQEPGLDLTLAHYVTRSVSVIDKCHISWIILRNSDCATPVIPLEIPALEGLVIYHSLTSTEGGKKYN